MVNGAEVSSSGRKPSLRLGAIGLGRMGAPMLGRWLTAGYSAWVWARRQETLESLQSVIGPLQRPRLHIAQSIAELQTQVDVVILNVSDTPDVEALVNEILSAREVLSGKIRDRPSASIDPVLTASGVVEHRSRLIIVDHSTIDATATQCLADQASALGVDFIDAPVSGGVIGAETGTLTVFLGGDEVAIEQISPWLDCVASARTHLGPAGAGQIGKMTNQILIGASLVALGDVLNLARVHGIDAARLREALLGGFAASRVLDHHGGKLIADDRQPGFTVALHAKDAALVRATLKQAGLDIRLSDLVCEALDRASMAGEERNDSSRLACYRSAS